MTIPKVPLNTRVERELERERNERSRNDEERTGLVAIDEFRTKDARENMGLVNVKRPPGR